MLIILDIQHRGQVGRIHDRGTVSGATEETDLTTRYAVAADHELRRLGHTCILLADGTYAERAERAERYGAGAYVACHINGGGGNRGEVFYDHRSRQGPDLAALVAVALEKVCPWKVLPRIARPDPTWVQGMTRTEMDRAFRTIQHVGKPVAICYEPGFIDSENEVHRAFVHETPEKFGVALAQGIDSWAGSVAS